MTGVEEEQRQQQQEQERKEQQLQQSIRRLSKRSPRRTRRTIDPDDNTGTRTCVKQERGETVATSRRKQISELPLTTSPARRASIKSPRRSRRNSGEGDCKSPGLCTTSSVKTSKSVGDKTIGHRNGSFAEQPLIQRRRSLNAIGHSTSTGASFKPPVQSTRSTKQEDTVSQEEPKRPQQEPPRETVVNKDGNASLASDINTNTGSVSLASNTGNVSLASNINTNTGNVSLASNTGNVSLASYASASTTTSTTVPLELQIVRSNERRKRIEGRYKRERMKRHSTEEDRDHLLKFVTSLLTVEENSVGTSSSRKSQRGRKGNDKDDDNEEHNEEETKDNDNCNLGHAHLIRDFLLQYEIQQIHNGNANDLHDTLDDLDSPMSQGRPKLPRWNSRQSGPKIAEIVGQDQRGCNCNCHPEDPSKKKNVRVRKVTDISDLEQEKRAGKDPNKQRAEQFQQKLIHYCRQQGDDDDANIDHQQSQGDRNNCNGHSQNYDSSEEIDQFPEMPVRLRSIKELQTRGEWESFGGIGDISSCNDISRIPFDDQRSSSSNCHIDRVMRERDLQQARELERHAAELEELHLLIEKASKKHSKELKALEQKNAEERKKREELLEMALCHAEVLEATEREQAEQLNTKDRVLEDTIREHSEQLKNVRDNQSKEIAAKEYAKQLESFNRKHKEELEQERKAAVKCVMEANRKHDEQLELIIKNHEEELRKERQAALKESALKLEELTHERGASVKCLEEIEQQHKEQLKLLQEREEYLKEALKESELELSEELRSLKERHREEIDNERQAAVKDIALKHEQELEILKNNIALEHELETASLRNRFQEDLEQEVELALAESAPNHAEEIQHLRKLHEQQLADLQASHQMELVDIEKIHENELTLQLQSQNEEQRPDSQFSLQTMENTAKLLHERNATIENLKQEKEDTESKVVLLLESLAAYQAQIESLQMEGSAKEGKLKKLTKALEQQESRMEELQGEDIMQQKAAQKMAAVAADSAKMICDLEEALKERDDEIAQLEAELQEQLDSRIEELHGANTLQQQTVAKEMAAAKVTAAASAKKIHELQEALKERDEEIVELEAEARELHESHMEELKGKDTMQQHKAADEMAVAKATAAASSAKMIRELQEALKERDGEISELETELEDFENEIERRNNQQHSQSAAAADELQVLLKEKESRIRKLEEESVARALQIRKLEEGTHNQVSSRSLEVLQDLQDSLRERDTDIENLEADHAKEVQMLRNELKENERQHTKVIAAMVSKMTGLQTSLEDQMHKVAVLKEDHRKSSSRGDPSHQMADSVEEALRKQRSKKRATSWFGSSGKKATLSFLPGSDPPTTPSLTTPETSCHSTSSRSYFIRDEVQ